MYRQLLLPVLPLKGDCMKKRIIKLISVLFAVNILLFSVITANALTLYEWNGYTYSIINNYSVSIYDWDESSEEFIVPDKIFDRYVADIANYALEESQINSLNLSNTKHLETIGVDTFRNCTAISNDIVIPESVTKIKDGAFSNCLSIPSVTINGKLTYIANETFNKCTALKTAVLPDTVVTIYPFAFGNCTSLEYINIPSSVTEIKEAAFYNCPNLVLGVYKDSYGLQYAEENEIDHIILDGDKTGDVNSDGVVDILDATEIQKYAAESTDFTDEQFELGDINKDGYCDVIDALLVQKSVIGAYEIPQNIIRY